MVSSMLLFTIILVAVIGLALGECFHEQAKCRGTFDHNDCCDVHMSCADGYKAEATSEQCGYGGEGVIFQCCKPEVAAPSPKAEPASLALGECVHEQAKCRGTFDHNDCCDVHMSCADGYTAEATSEQCGYGGEGFIFQCCKPEVAAPKPKAEPASLAFGECVHEQAKCRGTFDHNDCCDVHMSCADGYRAEATSEQCGYGGDGVIFQCCKPEVAAASPKAEPASPRQDAASPTTLIISTVGIVAVIVLCSIACSYFFIQRKKQQQEKALLVSAVAGAKPPVQANTDTIGAAEEGLAQAIETTQATETNAEKPVLLTKLTQTKAEKALKPILETTAEEGRV